MSIQSIDRRESILAQLLVVARSVTGVVTAVRNQPTISETARPGIIILDADEAGEDTDPVRMRPSNAPRRIIMSPEQYLLLSDKATDVGSSINALRRAYVKAVLTDATLIGLVGTNGDIRYDGCATALAQGRTMDGQMGVSISFYYMLNPAEL